jgi:hypothetical protein
MKLTCIRKLVLALAVALFSSQLALAQVVTETTETTTTAGTVSEFGPETVILKTETTAAPVTYAYTKETTIVDETGTPVDIAMVKTGVPVEVVYVKEPDRMVARKIIVRKAVSPPSVVEEETTTTTTTEP